MTFKSSPTKLESLELLRQLFASTGNEELLAKLSKESHEILSAMEEADWDQIIDKEAAAKLDIEWLGRVYQALAKPHFNEGDVAIFESLFEGRTTDERKIGEAFECLIEEVSLPTREFFRYFGSLPDVPEIQKNELASSPSVKASSRAPGLVRWGITPITIFTATEAVALLVDRKLRRKKLSSQTPVLLSRDVQVPPPSIQQLPFQTVADEIRSATRCSEKAAGPILDWTIDAAQSVPSLYRGLRANACGTGIILTSDNRSLGELLQRWTRMPIAVAMEESGERMVTTSTA